MKKNISIITLLSGFALLFVGAIILSSCEGPMGPAGADGTDGINGIDGKDGVDGQDGVDGNGTCIVCHDADVVLFAKEQQTESSHHLEGGNYERNSSSCSVCHTHQGFTEILGTDLTEASGSIEDPAAINCRTCHMIHNNYDESDWALVSTTAVDLKWSEGTIDLGGSGNLCVNCHQFRSISPVPVLGGDSVSITSSRWGPHHGPQGNNVWGIGGILIAGSKSYPAAGSHPHASAGCNVCHMASMPYNGKEAGGHTFNMTYNDGEDDNYGACVGCHPGIADVESFDLDGVQTTVAGLIADLETIFIAKGWIDEPGDLWNASSSKPLKVTAEEAAAMLNYKIVTEDRSEGIHNPAYMVALLTNSLESLQ